MKSTQDLSGVLVPARVSKLIQVGERHIACADMAAEVGLI